MEYHGCLFFSLSLSLGATRRLLLLGLKVRNINKAQKKEGKQERDAGCCIITHKVREAEKKKARGGLAQPTHTHQMKLTIRWKQYAFSLGSKFLLWPSLYMLFLLLHMQNKKNTTCAAGFRLGASASGKRAPNNMRYCNVLETSKEKNRFVRLLKALLVNM